MRLCRYLVLFLFILAGTSLADAQEPTEEAAVEEPQVAAPKPDREKQVSEKIERLLKIGDAHWLGGNEDPFLTIYTESELPESEGAILILHDLGANLNWPRLILPLRLRFPKSGWHSFSVQLPVIDPEQEKKEFLPEMGKAISRVEAAVDYLQQLQTGRIVILAHGYGATVATLYLVKNPQAPIAAMVGLSLPGPESLKYSQASEATSNGLVANNTTQPGIEVLNEPEKSTAASQETTPQAEEKTADATVASAQTSPVIDRDFFQELEKLRLPLLDVYATHDHLDVIRYADKRARLIRKSKHQDYLQMEIEGANHYFVGLEDRLSKRIRGWLRKNARHL